LSDALTYRYASPSALEKTSIGDQLLLSHFNEIKRDQQPCFFYGKLTDPYITARCLITLSNIVQSSFSLSPFQLALIKDPIVTAGNQKMRFEGFSQCAGVYGRVDVLEDGLDGEFLSTGTTNVDFNQPMISSLSRVNKSDKVLLSVGSKDVTVIAEARKVVERKVPLPVKWIKGLTSVQIFLARTEKHFAFNRVQALQLFQTIPSGKSKSDYFLVVRGGRPMFSPVASVGALCIGGVHRLRLLEQLIPHISELRVFTDPAMQATTWQLYFGKVRFCFSLSRDAWRGFSGEGAALEDLIGDVPEHWINQLDQYSYANHAFNPTMLAMEEGIDFERLAGITARLSAMGLLGYDVDDNQFYYRQLPYKSGRIMSLNPRLKGANKLIEEKGVTIVSNMDDRVEALVAGTAVQHTVVLDKGRARCTCTWFSQNQGERGLCKHVLAVKIKLQS
jgi:hypothetical protein